MFPTVACLGPFCLQTLSIFLVIGFFVTGMIFFRKVREEHYLEMEAFDSFFLSLLVGLVVGRLAYIGVHWSQFGLSFNRWLDVIAYPGVMGSVAVAVAGLALYRFSKNLATDRFELLDIWSMAVTAGLSVIWLGLFLDGASLGNATTLPIGLKFPGLLEAHLPVQLFVAVFFLLLSVYLHWVEYRYRTYNWYRYSKKSAQSGFLVSISLIATSLVWVILSFLRPTQFEIAGQAVDPWVGTLGVMCGLVLLFVRSGRRIGGR